MPTEKLKAAVIGCGYIGVGKDSTHSEVGIFSHAAALFASPHTELVALGDCNPNVLNEAAMRFGVNNVFTDIKSMLAVTAPEFVSIATPDQTHADIASVILDCPSVKLILLEKPIATNAREGANLIKKAAEQDVLLAVNFSRRYATKFQSLRREISNGLLGKLQTVVGFYGKGILHNGSHWIDLLRLLTGEEILKVRAIHHADQKLTDPTPDVSFGLSSGLSANLFGCKESAYSIFEMDLIGTAGRLQISNGGQNFEFYTPQPSLHYPDYSTLQASISPIIGDMKDLILHAVNNLVLAYEQKVELISPGSEALVPVFTVEAILRSLSKGGCWEKVKPSPFS